MSQQKRQLKKIYCIAICGMGMGSLAGLLKAQGYEVLGSDAHVYPPMSDQLRNLGILVHEGYDAKNVPSDCDLVIIGNAISKGHPEVLEVERRGFPVLSMADALAEFFLHNREPVVVAGTHGKTTVTSMVSWMLTSSGHDPSFLVGGILKNFDHSWRLGSGPHFVVEGDEYDTAFFDKTPKFLHYRPRHVILNPVEFDHADIYQDLEQILEAFRSFVRLIPPEGTLVACGDSPNVLKLVEAAPCPVMTFGEGESSAWRLNRFEVKQEKSTLFFTDPEGRHHELRSPMVGRHNALNLLGAVALLSSMGLGDIDYQSCLDGFEGIKRRQEVRGIARQITVIDDFAHHPTAVSETLNGLKEAYPGQRLWAVFEPRSNTSRRKIFENDFAHALSVADRVIVAAPYDNGKIPKAELFDSEHVAAMIRQQGGEAKAIATVDDIIAMLGDEAHAQDVVAVLSNGGFDDIHEKLLTHLREAE